MGKPRVRIPPSIQNLRNNKTLVSITLYCTVYSKLSEGLKGGTAGLPLFPQPTMLKIHAVSSSSWFLVLHTNRLRPCRHQLTCSYFWLLADTLLFLAMML